MSSPRSAPPSSDITRQHTPAAADGGGSAASENGDDAAAAGNGEEQLPEKLRFLLSQSTIYSSIIAQQLAKATQERQKKDDRATRRKELKQEREQKQETLPVRETRRGTAKPTSSPAKKPPQQQRNNKKKLQSDSSDSSSSSSEEEIVVTSRRSSESRHSSRDDSVDHHRVKAHDFEKDNDSKAAARSSRSTRGSATSPTKKSNGNAGVNGKNTSTKNGKSATATTTKNGKKKNNVKNDESEDSDDDDASMLSSSSDSETDKATIKTKKEEEEQEKAKQEAKDKEDEEEADDLKSRQPALVTGATMKSYQIAGLEWLISLYENGLNGILADEMGLGKTLQTISFLAHLRQQGVWGPFLVCCPLSTLANWVNEFERFTPDIPVLLYHGTPQERAELRASRLAPPRDERKSKSQAGLKKTKRTGDFIAENTTETFPIVVTSYELVMNDRKYLAAYNWKYLVIDESHRLKNLNCKLIRELMSYKSANRLLLTGTPLQNNLEELWSLLNFLMPDIFDDLDSFKSWFDIDVTLDDSASHQVVTKLHAILKPFLLRRVKREVEKSLPPKKEYLLSAPLTIQQKKLYDAVIKRQIREFLLSRKDLLPENADGEPVAPFSSDDDDMEIIKTVKRGGKSGKKKTIAPPSPSSSTASPKRGTKRKSEVATTASSNKKARESSTTSSSARNTRARPSSYVDESSDDEDWLDALDDGTAREKAEELEEKRFGKSRLNMVKNSVAPEDGTTDDDGASGFESQATKKIKGLKLSNMVMQLRKVVNHPWLFEWPMDPKTGEYVLDERIVTSSGKMMLLDKLLGELFKTGHKVLVYSQFTTQLDIIEDWAVEWKGWKICRIDGRTPQEDRRSQLKSFNDNKTKNAPKLFLLSTRSGGVGINLVGADTVILFDSDWNPQMDLQAMDRVHRLGQTKPVLIFRLVTANTIEAKMLERAGNKRKLEALVIGSGKYTASLEDLQDIFKGGKSGSNNDKAAGFAAQMVADEMRGVTTNGDGESADKEIRVIKDGEEVISSKQLALLLDRSDDAMKRGRGWKAEGPAVGKTAPKAFEVIETVAADGGDEQDELDELFKHESRTASPKTENNDTD